MSTLLQLVNLVQFLPANQNPIIYKPTSTKSANSIFMNAFSCYLDTSGEAELSWTSLERFSKYSDRLEFFQ